MRFLIPAFTLFFFACVSKNTNSLDFDKLIYEFHDSSVPPEYHRSFTITLSLKTIEKCVDSYGDTISYAIKKSDASQMKKLVTLLKEAKISTISELKEDGCTGGTGVSIYCFMEKKQVFKGHVNQCGGKTSGNMQGNTEKILAFLNELMNKTN